MRIYTRNYTKIFNMRTNEEQLKEWRDRAKEKELDLSNHIRKLLKEDLEKAKNLADQK